MPYLVARRGTRTERAGRAGRGAVGAQSVQPTLPTRPASAARMPRPPKASKLVLMRMAGADYAPVRRDLPALGMPGCRAPFGRISIDVPAWPPSKSNNNTIVSRANGTATLALTPKMRAFHEVLAEAILATYRAIGHEVMWFRPSSTENPRVANPLFGPDIEVAVAVELYEPYRSNRDIDGVWKALFDVGTCVGLFHDDLQIGATSVDHCSFVGMLSSDLTRIHLTAIPGPASWSRNPNKRPVSTHIARRWVESGRFVARADAAPSDAAFASILSALATCAADHPSAPQPLPPIPTKEGPHHECHECCDSPPRPPAQPQLPQRPQRSQRLTRRRAKH